MNLLTRLANLTPGVKKQNQEFQKLVDENSTQKEIINMITDPSKREDLRGKVNQIALQTKSLTEQDVQKWRSSHATALNVDNPQRGFLYALYHDVMLDGHLKAAWMVRTEMILKSKFVLVDDKGKEDTEKTQLLQRSWFMDYLMLAMDSKPWGHTLVQFTERRGNEFSKIDLVPREHVKPEKAIITREPADEKGWSYLEPPFSQYCVSIGKSNDFGFLLEASPLIISKKYMGQFWDQFAEVFAVPIRIAKVPEGNTTAQNKAAQMLEDMGRAPWGVFGTDTDIQIVETAKQDSFNVYDKRMDRIDREISKLVFGQTMLMDNGSSLSQAQVHQQLAEMISDSDRRFLATHMNEALIPFLITHGYPFNGLQFKWDDANELSFEEQLKVDQWLVQNFEVDLEYFKEKYNGKIVGYKATAAPIGGGDPAGK